MIRFIDVIFLSYLLGNIPTGALISRLLTGIDVQKYGSGKTGTANVIRTAGIKAGVITALADLAKGGLAVLLARVIIGSETVTLGHTQLDYQSAQALAALLVIVGHNWPVFLKFRGGSGVTTFFAGLLVIHWPTGLFGGSLVLLVLGATRYFSLGSLVGTVSATLTMLALVLSGRQPLEYLIYTGIATGLILFRHRDNIRRLKAGTERKLGERVPREQPPLP